MSSHEGELVPLPHPEAVRICIGHEVGAHVRIRGARIIDGTVDGKVLTGVLEPGWTRLYVLYYPDRSEGAQDDTRLMIFEPAPGESADWRFRAFFVRGPVKLVERVNNSVRARKRFAAAPKLGSPPRPPEAGGS